MSSLNFFATERNQPNHPLERLDVNIFFLSRVIAVLSLSKVHQTYFNAHCKKKFYFFISDSTGEVARRRSRKTEFPRVRVLVCVLVWVCVCVCVRACVCACVKVLLPNDYFSGGHCGAWHWIFFLNRIKNLAIACLLKTFAQFDIDKLFL